MPRPRADRKKEEEQQQQQRPRFHSPSTAQRRLSNTELSPKNAGSNCGFNSEPSSSCASNRVSGAGTRCASQPATASRSPLVATAQHLPMKQNLSELHFTGTGILSPPGKTTECCSLQMRPRSSTLCSDGAAAAAGGAGGGSASAGAGKQRDNLTNLQLSPVQKHKSTVSL